MKNHWKAVAALTVAGTSLSFATFARVESMGKHDTYFMDDISVWTNPANSNIYPNYLMGDLGSLNKAYADQVALKTAGSSGMSALARYNQDPAAPWFGAVFAKSLGDEKSANRYPQITIGGAFNRDDEMLPLLGRNTDSIPVKVDGMLGFASSNGMMFGIKGYIAGNDQNKDKGEKSAWLSRYTVGANIPLAQGVDFEVSGGANYFAYTNKDFKTGGDSLKGASDIGFDAKARAFISLPAISGELVPAASFMTANPLDAEITDVKAGLGCNVSLDRGFFWIGTDYVYYDAKHALAASDTSSKGVRVSFGIERNVWTDWLVLRVGGQKYMKYEETNNTVLNKDGAKVNSNTKTWVTNPINDGTNNDHVGFGIGINIEDKLKIDATMGEDIVFTGGALLSGPVDHIFSRISATYSF
jgi:hypothetical protein